MESRQTFLVIEPFAVIAEDLAMSIADFDPTAEVRIARSMDTALAMVEPLSVVTLAVVHEDPALFMQSNLNVVLTARGAKVVLIGDTAEEATGHAGFAVMHRPYAPESVVALLAAVLGQGNQLSGATPPV